MGEPDTTSADSGSRQYLKPSAVCASRARRTCTSISSASALTTVTWRADSLCNSPETSPASRSDGFGSDAAAATWRGEARRIALLKKPSSLTSVDTPST